MDNEDILSQLKEVRDQQKAVLLGLKTVSDGQKALGESFVTEVEQIKSIQKAQGRASAERLEGVERNTDAFLSIRKMSEAVVEHKREVARQGKDPLEFRAISGVSERLKNRPVRKLHRTASAYRDAVDIYNVVLKSGLPVKALVLYSLLSTCWTALSIGTWILNCVAQHSNMLDRALWY